MRKTTRTAVMSGMASIPATGGAGAALAASILPELVDRHTMPVAIIRNPNDGGSTSRDGKLLHLGKELIEAWAAELATDGPGVQPEIVRAAVRRSGAIARKIEAVQAHTVEDLQMKAMAVRWACGGDLFSDDHDTTNLRLACSIVEDLLKMGGRP